MKITYKNPIVVLLYLLAAITLIVGVTDVQYLLPFPTLPALGKYLLAIIILFLLLFFSSLQGIHFRSRDFVIEILFFIQFLLISINMLTTDELDANIKFSFTLLASVLVYILFQQKNIKNMSRIIVNYYKFIFYFLSLVTVTTFLLLYLSMGDYWGLKDSLKIPIGGSNFIECWILMVSVFLIMLSKETSDILKFLIIGFIAALCTRTKVGLLSWGLLGVFIFYIKRRNIFKLNGRFLIAIIFSIITIGNLFQWAIQNDFFEYSIHILEMLFSGDQAEIDTAFNGRLELYNLGLGIFSDNILIGAGMGKVLAHNYVIEDLASMGLIGTMSALFQYIIIINGIVSNWRKSIFARPALCVLVAILFNSMYEPCINEMFFNIFFWMILSLGTNRYIGSSF